MKLFALSCAAFVVGGVSGSALGVVWIYVQADFDVTLSALGALVSVATLGRVIASAGSGPLINRWGIARAMMLGLAITAGSMFGFTLAESWLVVMVVAFSSGLGAGAMATGLNAFAAVHFSARRMNWLHGSYGVGSTLGPLLITTIVIDLALDWRYAYVLFTLIRLALLVCFWLTRGGWRISEDMAKRDADSHARLPATLRLPIVWLMIGAFAFATGAELVTGQFANSLLIEARQIDAKTAGAWVSVYWASLTVSRFAAGFVIARVSNGAFLRANSLCVLLGAALLALNPSEWVSLGGLALIGFCVAPFAPVMASDTPGRVGGSHVANAIGLQFTGAGLGMAVLPWLAGLLAEARDLDIIPLYIFAIALAAFALHEAILLRERRAPASIAARS